MNKSTKKNGNEPILVCQHLLNNAGLFQVYHLPNETYKWQMVCMGEHDRSHMTEITLAEACELFPEIEQLLDTPDDMEIMFQKGINSGRWYDFHFEKK